MCVFRPVFQLFGSDIAHVLHESRRLWFFCQPVQRACVKMASRVGKHESSYYVIIYVSVYANCYYGLVILITIIIIELEDYYRH